MKKAFREIHILIIAIIFLCCFAIILFYRDSQIQKVPINYSKWQDEVSELKAEMNNLAISSDFEIIETEDMSKHGQSIFLSVRYKSRLPEKQFISEIKTELENKKFVYIGRKQESYSFCRNELEAVIYSQGKGGIFSDDTNKYKLIFLSDFEGYEGISQVCQ